VVLDRRSGERHAIAALQRARGAGLFALGVLDVLRFVEHDAAPADLLEEREITMQQRIARDDERVAPRGFHELRVPLAARSVVDVHG